MINTVSYFNLTEKINTAGTGELDSVFLANRNIEGHWPRVNSWQHIASAEPRWPKTPTFQLEHKATTLVKNTLRMCGDHSIPFDSSSCGNMPWNKMVSDQLDSDTELNKITILETNR